MPKLSAKPTKNTVPDGAKVAGIAPDGRVELYLADRVGSQAIELVMNAGGPLGAGDA